MTKCMHILRAHGPKPKKSWIIGLRGDDHERRSMENSGGGLQAVAAKAAHRFGAGRHLEQNRAVTTGVTGMAEKEGG